MFLRRLYFVVPDESGAAKVVADLEAAGVNRRYIHALAGKGATLEKLPMASERQRRDTVWRLEQILWTGNLALFGVAAVGLFISLLLDAAFGAFLAIAIMLLSFLAGFLFATRVPDAHLDEFRGVLAHPEVLLMVDVPKRRVAEIEELISRRHPEVTAWGAGWTIEALQI